VVETLNDLAPGMDLEGVVTNVASFGASSGRGSSGWVGARLGNGKDCSEGPREIVKPGDIVRVKVFDVDKPRKRIALTLRLDDEVGRNPGGAGPRTPPPSRREPTSGGALADALRRAGVAADKNGPIRTKPR
jgi:uncharacterized protein